MNAWTILLAALCSHGNTITGDDTYQVCQCFYVEAVPAVYIVGIEEAQEIVI